MKKNIIIFFLFVIAVTVFLLVITYTNTNSNQTTIPKVNINKNTAVIECYKDADCLVAGCSNQLCVPRDKAPSIVTTCEWKDEYACYAEDSCLCRNNKCQWAGGQRFTECIRNL